MPSQYDAFAKDFSTSRTHRRPWPEFGVIGDLIHPMDRVLDLGCGNARLRDFLPNEHLRNGNYYGMDISRELLSIARQKYPKDHFFIGDFAQPLRFGADNFDMVTSIAAFHHLLTKKDQIACLKELYRVTKPGGYVFLTTWKIPKKYFWPNVLKGRFKNWIVPFGNEKHPRTYRWVKDRELKKLLKKAGFVVKRAELFHDRNYIALAQKPK